MIKNWTVITQPVKFGSHGVACRERYLTSITHPNHRHTQEIYSIIGNRNTSGYIALLGEQYLLKQKMTKKSGRHLSSFAMEYCLTLPKGITPSNEQWKNIITYCCRSILQVCNLKEDEIHHFKKNIRAVLHRQDQSSKHGSGDHVHLIIGKVLAGTQSRVLIELQQKKVTKALKTAFNLSVLKELGLHFRDYTPNELNRNKKLEVWKYHHNKHTESIRIQSRLQNQLDKWFSAYRENDTIQINRQFKRIKKTYISLINNSTHDESLDNVNDKIREIERLSGRNIKG